MQVNASTYASTIVTFKQQGILNHNPVSELDDTLGKRVSVLLLNTRDVQRFCRELRHSLPISVRCVIPCDSYPVRTWRVEHLSNKYIIYG